jgi:hypothetical protein
MACLGHVVDGIAKRQMLKDPSGRDDRKGIWIAKPEGRQVFGGAKTLWVLSVWHAKTPGLVKRLAAHIATVA